MMWQSLSVALLVLGACTQLADAHAYLAEPKARNWLYAHQQPSNFYDEMSLNNNKLSYPAGVCGGQWANDARFSVAAPGSRDTKAGIFAKGVITGRYTQGQTITVTIKQSTPHWGRFELRLCPLSDASAATEYKELSESCLDAHRLYLAPNSYQAGLSKIPERYYYFVRKDVENTATVTASFSLPSDVTCARCVLQWRWVTGNSCYAPGTNVAHVNSYSPNLPACNPSTYLESGQGPEKFWNCADVAISRRGSAPGGKTAPKPTPKGPRVVTPKPAKKPARKPAKKPTPKPAKKPTPKPRPAAVSAKRVVNAWQQCGGIYGNPAYKVDKQWPGTSCATKAPQGPLKCTRYSAGYWQCYPANQGRR